LRIEDVDVPPTGKGEIQIRIHSRGLNRAVVMFRTGQFVSQPRLPARLDYEAAGTVAAIGEGVKRVGAGYSDAILLDLLLPD
jgi:NADPH:quinone reductase-like Zn-dependent oxidoreductase